MTWPFVLIVMRVYVASSFVCGISGFSYFVSKYPMFHVFSIYFL